MTYLTNWAFSGLPLSGSLRWRITEQHAVLYVYSASAWRLWQLQCCSTAYQMRVAAFPQMLTCTTSPHFALLFSGLLIRLVSLCLSFSPSLFLFRKPKLVQRRRNTCPSPQDISRALQSPSSASSASAASLDELIQRCLNCFGQSLSRRVCMCSQSLSCVFTPSQPGYINKGWGRVRGNPGWEKVTGRGRESKTKGSLIQSSFVLLGCRG